MKKMDQTVLSRRVRKKKRRRTVDQEVRRRKRTQMERGITQSNPSPDRKMKLLRTEE